MLPDGNKKCSETLDHLLPRSKGGKNVLNNFVVSCGSCNVDRSSKNGKETIEWLVAKLKKKN